MGSGGTTTTSGSGTTEEYILECALAGTPLSDDGGTYPFTFTPTDVAGNVAAASGTLNVNVSSPTSTCLDPAAAGTTTTFTDGTAGSYTVECYSQGFTSASPGNYPTINIASGALPSSDDITFGGAVQTSCSAGSGGTTTTSGSGVTEEYITECKVAGTPTSADNDKAPSYPPYALTFSTTPGANGGSVATSGTLNLKIVGAAPTAGFSQEWYGAVAGVPFCYDWVTGTVTQANGGLPLMSIALGATPADVSDYQLENVNLANGSAQICGVMSSAQERSDEQLAPVVTNAWGSVTGAIDMSSYAALRLDPTTTNGRPPRLRPQPEHRPDRFADRRSAPPITNGATDNGPPRPTPCAKARRHS